jgi:hypothetical protein
VKDPRSPPPPPQKKNTHVLTTTGSVMEPGTLTRAERSLRHSGGLASLANMSRSLPKYSLVMMPLKTVPDAADEAMRRTSASTREVRRRSRCGRAAAGAVGACVCV